MSKTALITGGAKRIGKAICIELAEQGYNIALHYNTSKKEADETQLYIKSLGVKCSLFKCNLSNPDDYFELLPTVIKVFPDLQILVNNASIFNDRKFFDVNFEYFNKDFGINFIAPFFLTQHFAKLLGKGLIINMLDTRINKTSSYHFVYNLAKQSLFHFTKMAAKELGPSIRINGICPGPILPPPDKDEKYLSDLAEIIPLKKVGSPKNITLAVKYLIENDFVTGESLFVDGGNHLIY